MTSIADVLAGVVISGFFASGALQFEDLLPVFWLSLSTVGLYGGGIIFNDVYDAELDRIERPERPIPSGKVKVFEASLLGGILLIFGVLMAFLYSQVSAIIAILIALCALLYDKAGKHHSFFGPINMGLCRGLNLLLGISIIPSTLNDLYWLAIIPVIYISTITLISRGEVHGGSRATLYSACALYGVVIAFILYFSFTRDQIVWTLLFLLPFAWMIFRPLLRAIREPLGKNIGKAVKAGVISLILMNAAWAAAFGSITIALGIAALLPLSLWLSKLFAVT
jgi:4-hydroxybenzoate polyprenyltransferase